MKISNRFIYLFSFFSIFVLSLPGKCVGLDPAHVFVIVNTNVKEGVALADYYMEKRAIPKENRIDIGTLKDETCQRKDYEKDISNPVRTYLKKRSQDANTSCLVLMVGMPLRIAGQKGQSLPEKKRQNRQIGDTVSSVDSEIALVYETEYPLSGWIRNPLAADKNYRELYIDRKNVFMVSRIDGPSPEIVKRLIDESIDTEIRGLKGNACLDARWPEAATEDRSGYRLFDASIHRAARKIKESGRMPVILNSSEGLFQKGECPDAAFYCGWYSLGNYIDAFQWVKGAIGYHIASSECITLKKPGSRVWCKAMIEKGVSATLGPVDEPYVESFPPPDLFFSYLSEGRCLAEAYIKSTPFLSWKMVLVGDPLYRPFNR